MIHNPQVNEDLKSRGVQFLMDTKGNNLIPFENLEPGDIVIVPAFGTTLEIEQKLLASGVEIEKYNTTCPFVRKVWNKAEAIAKQNYTVVVHGKPRHEETRATFSHSAVNAPTVVIKDMKKPYGLQIIFWEEKNWIIFIKNLKGSIPRDLTWKKICKELA